MLIVNSLFCPDGLACKMSSGGIWSFVERFRDEREAKAGAEYGCRYRVHHDNRVFGKNACFWAEAEHNVKMMNSKFLYKGSAEMVSGRNE